MTFYSAKYLEQQTNINDTIGIYLMVIAFVFMAVGAVAFLRNRMQTRYRDLSIIALLLFLFLAVPAIRTISKQNPVMINKRRWHHLLMNLRQNKALQKIRYFLTHKSLAMA